MCIYVHFQNFKISKFQNFNACCILRPASVASAGSIAVTSFARFKNHCCKFPSLMFRVRICSPEKKCASSVTRCAHSARALAHLSSFALRVRDRERVCEREGERKKERDMGGVRERMHQCANPVTRSTNSARALAHF